MSVDYRNKEYSDYVDIWAKCSDCYDGEEEVKEGGEKYLPKLSGQLTQSVTIRDIDNPSNFLTSSNTSNFQKDTEYNSYKRRAKYDNYVRKVTDGLVEQLFRKNLKLDYPDAMEDVIKHFTSENQSFVTAVKESNKDMFLNYRSVLLLDMPSTGLAEDEVISVKQSEDTNLRPYAVYYKASDVINWKYEYINNKPTLTLVVIQETVEDYTNDEFQPEYITQLRVLDIFEGYYRVRLFNGSTEGDWSTRKEEEVIPVFYGKKLDFIPCYFITQKGLSFDLEKPLMNDTCNINLGHYINSADYENALNITGSPTPVIIGMTYDSTEQVEIGLGSSNALILNGEGADAKYLEYNGLGPTCLKDAMKDKVDAMSVIAGKMLQNDPAGVESAETAKIHRQAEFGQLASIANSLSEVYKNILQQIADWMGISGEITVQFNTDYIDATMSSQLLTSLVSALMSGSISNKVFYYMMEKGELVPPDWSFEKEQDAIVDGKIESAELNAKLEPEESDNEENEDEDEEDNTNLKDKEE